VHTVPPLTEQENLPPKGSVCGGPRREKKKEEERKKKKKGEGKGRIEYN
jgi:hypothetical protein